MAKIVTNYKRLDIKYTTFWGRVSVVTLWSCERCAALVHGDKTQMHAEFHGRLGH